MKPVATNLWEQYFQMHKLTVVMRQKDDLQFAALLNRLREGQHTSSDIRELKNHLINTDSET